jgi:hypothetical protein
VIARKLDGLGLGIEDHDATMSVLRAAPLPASSGYFDLQVFEEPLQVKTAIPRGGFVPAANFFKFQTIGAAFACSPAGRNTATLAGRVLRPASLAASAIVRISCPLVSRF